MRETRRVARTLSVYVDVNGRRRIVVDEWEHIFDMSYRPAWRQLQATAAAPGAIDERMEQIRREMDGR